MERTLGVCHEVLANKLFEAKDLDALLLVGGQSRYPLIHERIENEFGIVPSKAIHPDEAVALGTALLAHSIGGAQSFRFRDVLPMSVGIGVPGGKCVRVIERNTVLPFEKRYKISATPGSDGSFELMVFQGEAQRVEDNEYLGTVTLSGHSAGRTGKANYAVLFALSQECILTVTATDLDSGEEVRAVMSATDTPDTITAKLARTAGAAEGVPQPGGTIPVPKPKTGGLPEAASPLAPESETAAEAADASADAPVRPNGWFARLLGKIRGAG